VYQPPPDQVALLQKQFQMAPNMPPEVRTGQPSSSRGPPAPETNPASKSGGSEPQPPATKTAPRPAATVLIVSRFPFGSDGKHFDSLKAAFAAAVAEQDTIIEIHDNGPIFEGPVAVAGRNLTLRAGKGFRPLIVWDIQAAASARSPQFFSMARGSLAMENLDIGLKVADLSQDERTSLFRIEGGDLSAESCTFSVAGRHRAGTSVIRIDPSRAEVGPCKCRLVNCWSGAPM